MIGVNNRNLDTLAVDRTLSARLLRDVVPKGAVVVAESGFETPESLADVRGIADGVLVGSALMRSENPGTWIRSAHEGARAS